MKVSYDEDLANHIDPESCVCGREAVSITAFKITLAVWII